MRPEEDIDSGRQFIFDTLPDLSGYTDIYLGIPVWWATLPQQAKSFLQSPELNLSGKTIHLYSSHLGSRFGDMLEQTGRFGLMPSLWTIPTPFALLTALWIVKQVLKHGSTCND
ncbi:MAG: hypothetical protein IJ769_05740, partial [Clostridia bacterium]|nr:hypothetical protein [Clostridia bacterium]